MCPFKGLVTYYWEGGGYKTGGGQVKFTPTKRGEQNVLAILMGGRKKFPPFKRMGEGCEKVSDPRM